MHNVENANFNTKYTIQADLEKDISKLIEKYDGKLSLAQFIGVLEIVKSGLLKG